MKTLSKSEVDFTFRPVKILQYGNGNFLRAFADWMVQKLIDQNLFDGGIHTVQIHSPKADPKMIEQDCLFHVLEKGLKNGKVFEDTTLISCVQSYSSIYESYEDYLILGENPDLRFILSNTTESGIQFDSDDDEPKEIPTTYPGKLTALLYRRFQFFDGDISKGLHFLPCELIEKNGRKLKECILQYADLWKLPEGFAKWIEEGSYFYDTLVDRIVPGFPKDGSDIEFEDKLQVMAEPFHFWAIEGPEKIQEELPFPKAGLDVSFVADLTPYRTRKVRILNGAHTCLVPYAYLQGLRTVRESVEHSEVGTWLKELIATEIVPILDMDKGELETFANAVLERFANPFIRHELKSIALNSISKFKVRVLPSILDFFNQNGAWPEKMITAFAATILFYKGDVNGETMPLNDSSEVITFFEVAWSNPDKSKMIQAILQNSSLWDQDLSLLSGLQESLVESLEKLEEKIA